MSKLLSIPRAVRRRFGRRHRRADRLALRPGDGAADGPAPALGLFTSILTAPITAALGRNPVLIGGTASATVPFLAAAVREQGVAGSAKLVLASSCFLILFGLFRLGRQVARVPHAVVSGFSCGVGAMMVALQLPTLLA